MPKGYWVVRVDVTDAERFKAYSRFVGDFVEKSDARFLVRGGQYAVPEGEARARTVVVEFPSYAAAQTAYSSAEYQSAIALRQGAGIVDFVIVEGVDA